MDEKAAAKKGAEKAKELAEHIEHLAANVLTGDAAEHLSRAGNEVVGAINKTIEDMTIPDDTKRHLLSAEREILLAMKGFIDSALKEIDRVEKKGQKPEELKKIEIE